ncbi:MAG TPA: hypothetical protein VK580_19575 [Steroidobacteraceae bacterium]|jgi:hypothetical protein|nr:hypothetical protein [Steroidobacteraceae bacterium]
MRPPHVSTRSAAPAPIAIEPAPLARRALFGFIVTFIAARIVVLLIMSNRMPNLYFFMHGTHVHHLNYGIFLLAGVAGYLLFSARCDQDLKRAALGYGVAMALTFDEFGMWLHLGGSYWQRASVDSVIVVAAVLALIGFATAARNFESRHLKASMAVLIALLAFSVVLYDTSVHIGRVEGPRLEALELASSP